MVSLDSEYNKVSQVTPSTQLQQDQEVYKRSTWTQDAEYSKVSKLTPSTQLHPYQEVYMDTQGSGPPG